ncbi:sulfur carrier protein ThiS [Planctomicrobium piriforme]|uniref:Sulfur carrier protein n=1 Tax=Planctomicrobium piriforme TaxID=1576369 RepID=A0A1I3FYY5_9PLAN|nr:sulfur carrier protein ThiS [Planctomicrobium piriforme]SFI16377.1 sulfur carrier protein [Planctomicrobium piriforme]
MKIQVNGEPREIPENSTVADLLLLLKLDPRFLAVERNRELVPRTKHAECMLATDDELEIVTLVGGG